MKNYNPKTFKEYIKTLINLAKKGELSRCGVGNTCCYRNSDNTNGCFVGLLIPDDLYDPEFEGTSGSTFIERKPSAHLNKKVKRKFSELCDKISAIEGINSGNIYELQEIHDLTDDKGDFSKKVLPQLRKFLKKQK